MTSYAPYRKAAIAKPAAAPPAISHVELILKRRSRPSETRPIKKVGQSTKEARPNSTVTAVIRLSDATLMPSRKLLTHIELRIRGIKGFEIATNTNDGRKIPRVASSPPGIPPSR